MKTAPAQEDVPHALPCFKPDDLYSYHARATITRLLTEFLARNKITITELIHRADLLEKLEATGTLASARDPEGRGRAGRLDDHARCSRSSRH